MSMPLRALRRLRSDRGSTITELSLALVGLALMASMMIGFFIGVTSTDAVHRADDTALEDARNARALMSRDVREARRFTQAGPVSFTVWIDDEWDDVTDINELIVWSIDDVGALTRREGTADPQIAAGSIVEEESIFTYDKGLVSEIGAVDLHLVVASGTSEHVIDTHISLRNVP